MSNLNLYILALTTGILNVFLCSCTLDETPKSESLLRRITVLATNDIHGGVEPGLEGSEKVGGMAIWSGVVASIREGLKNRHGKNAGVLLLDAGDQFSGTLLSNFDEGEIVYSTMSEMGYDAVVPGNHAYDFGPRGWQTDKVQKGVPGNRRGALEFIVRRASFPLLSANTYFKDTISDKLGKKVEVDGTSCRPIGSVGNSVAEIDWSRASGPSFLKPYLIKEMAEVRVAIIALDLPSTPIVTIPENVSDLCFRDGFETYQEVRKGLEGKADIFVLLTHDGHSSRGVDLGKRVAELNRLKERSVDVVIAGHTHFINDEMIGFVPLIQSGAGGKRFGRVDLIWDMESKSLIHERMQKMGGLKLSWDSCDEKAKDFCDVKEKVLRYEGVPVTPNARVVAQLARAREDIKDLADLRIGRLEKPLARARITESALANTLTDGFLRAMRERLPDAKVASAMLNTGGIRDDLPTGDITYETFFGVLPFGNRAVVIKPMAVGRLQKVLEKSIQTCGKYGALMQSGFKVVFSRNCETPDAKKTEIDKEARLDYVATVDSEGKPVEVIIDGGTLKVPPQTEFTVATVDFLSSGGDGFFKFENAHVELLYEDLGILRDVLAGWFVREKNWAKDIDHRWEVKPR